MKGWGKGRNESGRFERARASLAHAASLLCFLFLLPAVSAALTISTTTSISASDLSFDGQDIVVDGAQLEMAGEHTFTSLTLINGAVMTHPRGYTGGLQLTADTVTVDASSKIDVSGAGYGGDGPGHSNGTTGASYGGHGGYDSGQPSPTYGSATQPTDLGSGDSSGVYGGGAVKIKAESLVLEGFMLADGDSSPVYGVGGASGGSILLEVGTLSGSGFISANGGEGYSTDGLFGSIFYTSLGGGGGRIAIYYGALNGSILGYGGIDHVDAKGGLGSGFYEWVNAEPGTLLFQDTSNQLHIVYSTPQGIQSTPVQTLSVQFNVPIDPQSFTPADVQITGPAGPLPIQSVDAQSDLEFTIHLASPTNQDGEYLVSIGPQIYTYAGTGMDQVYIMSYIVDTTPPSPPTVDGWQPAPAINAVSYRTVALSGGRDVGTEIWANGQRLDIDPGLTLEAPQLWYYDLVLSEGNSEVKLNAKDAAGNVSDDLVLQFQVDSLAPSVADTSPSSGSFINMAPTAIVLHVIETGTGLDITGSTLRVTRNGAIEPGDWQLIGNDLHFTPLGGFLDGAWTVEATLKDRGGLSASPYTANFHLDRVSPSAPSLANLRANTNIAIYDFGGSKESYAAILLNGVQIVGNTLDSHWGARINLIEGHNALSFVAKDRAGNLSPPTDVTITYDTTAPDTIVVNADGAGNGTAVTLDWTAYNEAANGGDIAHYVVYQSTANFTLKSAASRVAEVPAGTKTHTVDGLTRSQTYYFAVVAVDFAGNALDTVTPTSVVTTDIEPPPDVRNLRVEAFVDRLVVRWDAPVDLPEDLATYRVYFNGDSGTDIAVGATSHEVTGLAPATGYPVRIGSRDSSGNESAGISDTAITLLQNPSGLVATPYDGKVGLNWSSVTPADYVKQYAVYVQENDFATVDGLTAKLKVSPPTTNVQVAGLDRATNYYFAVTAINLSDGETKPVSTAHAKPTLDITGPNITAVTLDGVALNAGATATKNGALAATATDPAGVSRVEFVLDGATFSTDLDPSSGFKASWDITAITDGAHVLSIKAFDALDNATTLDIPVIVALAAPSAPSITVPANGASTNTPSMQVKGTAAKQTLISIYRAGAVIAGPQAVDASGHFSVPVTLAEGLNSLTAIAAHNDARGGDSPASNGVEITLDTTVPDAPVGLQAKAQPDGIVALTWNTSNDSRVTGYRVLRATTDFADPALASQANSSTVTTGRFDDLPAADGTYFYRVVAYNQLGTESALSSSVSATADGTRPKAVRIDYTPSGAFDPVTGRMAKGPVAVAVEVNEPLLTTPFLSLTPDGGTPIAIGLTKETDTTYSGVFDITDTTKSGTAYAVFSARDLVGNRGDVIEQGNAVVFDTDGPTVTQLELVPGDPIHNDQASPVAVNVAVTLDQPVRDGTVPELSYLLSGATRSLTAISGLTKVSDTVWRGSFDLPADAGLAAVETLELVFHAEDDLGNVGDQIAAPNRIQVYQGDLPPLAIPADFKATPLAGGHVALSWRAVDGAAAYDIWRQAPDETALTSYQRITDTSYTDSPTSDGDYRYAVASVRQDNGQEAVSELSTILTVSSDSVPPDVPVNLATELTSAGVRLLWDAPVAALPDEDLHYRVYRAAGVTLDDVTGLTPLQDNIVANADGQLGFIDAAPSKLESVYVVTAVDPAGNESLPSASSYLNIDLLPVSSLSVKLVAGGYPALSWTHNGENIQGYNVYLGTDTATRLNAALLATKSFQDLGYTGQAREYTVTAVDANDVESLGRTVSLVPLSVALDPESRVKRGIFNTVKFNVSNSSDQTASNGKLRITLNGQSYDSEPFEVLPGQVTPVSVVIGGTASLPDVADYQAEVDLTASTGEQTALVSRDQLLVGQDTLLLQVEAQEMTRGTEGQIRFVLHNTSAVETELLTAKAGGADSDEIRVLLLDTDQNLIATTWFKQELGAGVVNLADGRSVARIPAGGSFTSDWMLIPVPESAPDDVELQLAVTKLHYRLGRDREASIEGLTARLPASLVDTAYTATVDSVAPATSFGDEPIVITGQALTRDTATPLPNVPVSLILSANGFERQLEVVTDATGNYRYELVPLAGESGVYTVSAIHPDMFTRPGQGSFTINKIQVQPGGINLNVAKNYENNIDLIKVTTGEATTATNIRLAYDAADQPGGVYPTGVSLTPSAPISLDPNQSAKLPFTISADNSAQTTGTLVLKVYTDETGVAPAAVISVNYQFAEALPSLYFTPNFVETGVAHDSTVNETVTLENRGLADMLDMQLTLVDEVGNPAPTWLYLVTPASQGNLAVGDKRQVEFAASPTADIAEGVYPFKLRVAAGNLPATDINLFVSVTQSGIGSVLFKASDIYTATLDAEGNPIPGLTGASITVQNQDVLSVEQTLATDSYGEALFNDLPAGRYRYRASAPNHQDVSGSFDIKPGVTGTVEAFLDYDLISVEWSVTETTLQDKYEITLQTLFETDVPAAVVVLEPPSTTLPTMQPGDVYNGELRLTNYGLIRADNLAFDVPQDDAYFRYELMAGLPTSLDAKQSLVIPYRVTALAPLAPDGSASGGGCVTYTKTLFVHYGYQCANGTTTSGGIGHTWTVPVDVTYCGTNSNGEPRITYQTYSSGGGGSGSSSSGSSYQSLGGAQCIPTAPCPDCRSRQRKNRPDGNGPGGFPNPLDFFFRGPGGFYPGSGSGNSGGGISPYIRLN